MPAWLAGPAMKLAGGAILLLLFALSYWLTYRQGRKVERAEAKVADAKLRAEAAKASLGGYLGEKERLEGVDPVTGKPQSFGGVQ